MTVKSSYEPLLNAAARRGITIYTCLDDSGSSPPLYYDDHTIVLAYGITAVRTDYWFMWAILHELGHYDVAVEFGLQNQKDYGIDMQDKFQGALFTDMEMYARMKEEKILNQEGYKSDKDGNFVPLNNQDA